MHLCITYNNLYGSTMHPMLLYLYRHLLLLRAIPLHLSGHHKDTSSLTITPPGIGKVLVLC